MSDHWHLAKRVMIWNDEPPLSEPGRHADATTALLSGIARALQADQAAEVERLCRHAMRGSSDAFIPAMFLAARLLNGPSGVDEAESLILKCGIQENPERRAYAAALLAFAWAWREQRVLSERHAATALAALEDVDDEAFIGLVEMRLTQAAQWRGDMVSVNELAARSATRLERAGAFTLAANTLTFQCLPNIELGDMEAVRDILTRAARLADLGGAPTVKRTVANMRLAYAVMTGDDAEMSAYKATPFAHNAYDAFVTAVYFATQVGWHRRWHDFLAQLGNADPVSSAQQALKDAMIAVGATATNDDAEARSRWRRAVHRLAHGSAWNLSDTRIRRLARALACVAGATIGEVARAERAAVPLRGTRQLAVYTGEPEPTYAGFQRLVTAMRESRKAADPAVFLTPAQSALLKALASDASVPEIARQDPERRSVATIRSHVQHLYEALDVHSRTAAVLKAKELSLL
jgi:ATP/maltotriose-dependent transcriptional regulator MalT